MKTRGWLMKGLCSSLVAALILTAPGLPFHAALAQSISVRGQGANAGFAGPAGVQLPSASPANGLPSQGGVGDLTGSRSFADGVPAGAVSRPKAAAAPEQAAPDDFTRRASRADQRTGAAQAPVPSLAPAAAGVESQAAPRSEDDASEAPADVTLKGKAERVETSIEDAERAWKTPTEELAVKVDGSEKLDARRLYPESRGPVPPHLRPNGPDVPPSDGDGSGGISKAVWWAAAFFLVGQVVAQIGIDSWGTYFPVWASTRYGKSAYDTIAAIALVATLPAGYVGGVLVEKLGLKATYLSALALGALTIGGTLYFSTVATLPLWLLASAVSIREFLTGIARTAEQTIPVAIHRDDPEKVEQLNARAELALNAVSIFVSGKIGTLLTAFGTTGTLAAMPIAIGAAVLIYLLGVRVGDKPKVKGQSAERAEKDAKLLKVAKLAYPAFIAAYFLFVYTLASSYGTFVHPGTDPAAEKAAAVVTGDLFMGHGAGAMIAAASLSGGILSKAWVWLRMKLGFGPSKPTDPADSARLWMRLGAVGLLGFVTFLFKAPAIASAAMFFFGLTNIMGILKVLSLLQTNAPKGKESRVVGTARTWGIFVAALGIFGFGQLFVLFPGSAMPFGILLGVLSLFGAWKVWTASMIGRKESQKP